jgi:hypothetical protein
MAKIKIEIAMNDTPTPPRPSLKEFAQELIDEVEAGYASPIAWKQLRKLFNRMARAPKLSSCQKQVFEMIEPIIKKYGMQDSDGVELASAYPHEGADTFQYKERKE